MYQLHHLGWHNFQRLCHTITSEVLGQTVQAFLDSNDGGRDGAFTGTWKIDKQEDLDGPFVIQCKQTNRKGHSLRLSDISEELGKIERLVNDRLCNSYILMTNAGVSGTREEEIVERIKSKGVKHVKVFGSTWINQKIQENKRLRMLVPRLYGLGDLSQILDDRAYDQAKSILESMRVDLAKVVFTDTYKIAEESIREHGFVLLLGEPSSGKTTIASLLSLAALDQDGASILKLDRPDDITNHWNPCEPSQFIWIDDAFGVTQFDQFSVNRWNQVLPKFPTMIRQGARIVMTSRDYIYNRVRDQLKTTTFPLLKESQVVVDVHRLSIQEKEEILYNHIKLGDQSSAFRREIKPYLNDVARHTRFIPEIARRLGNRLFTKNLILTASQINDFVDRREGVLEDIIRNLDNDSRAALALIYIHNGSLNSPVYPQPFERKVIEVLGSSLAGCIFAMESLNESLVRYSLVNDEPTWKFIHPTIGDAFAATLADKREYIKILLQGAGLTYLLRSVTCGDVGIENAVIVPRPFFPLMIKRLESIKEIQLPSSDSETNIEDFLLFPFLTHRCSKEFLAMYLERNQELLPRISRPGLMLDTVPEVPLTIRLYELGLLPEEQRKTFVETVGNYAIEGDDASALSDERINNLFSDQEYDKLNDKVRSKTLSLLDDLRDMWQSNFDPHEENAEDYMQHFLEFLDSVSKTFREDPDAMTRIESERELTYVWIVDNTENDLETQPRSQRRLDVAHKINCERSIFDDVDALA